MADEMNPYAAPRAAVADVGGAAMGETQAVSLFGVRGRMGRLRYLVYGTLGLVVWFFALAAFRLYPLQGFVSREIVSLVGVLAYIVYFVLLSIRRSHDCNRSGWSVLLMVIPLVGLAWYGVPGNAGPNRFGPPPPPNTGLVWVLGVPAAVVWLLLAITLVRDLAKVAGFMI